MQTDFKMQSEMSQNNMQPKKCGKQVLDRNNNKIELFGMQS